MKFTIILIVIFSIVFAQDSNLVERYVIDDFTNSANSQSVSIELEAYLSPNYMPIISSDTSDFGSGCTGILGCERDMIIDVAYGLQGTQLDSEIESPGNWHVSASSESNTIYTLQYDGRDNDAENPDSNGLNNFDFTDNGYAKFIKFSGISDTLTALEIKAYSPNGDYCTSNTDIFQQSYSYTYNDTVSYIPLLGLIGNCDKTNIGYIELSIQVYESTDIFINKISVIGDPDPSPTPTPTPTISGSISVTPTNTPTPTITPSVSPSISKSSTSSLTIAASQSDTPTASTTKTAIATVTVSPSMSSSPTSSLTPGASASSSASVTNSISVTPTVSVTRSPSPVCDDCSTEEVTISNETSVTIETAEATISSDNAFEEGQSLVISSIPKDEIDVPDSEGVSSNILVIQLFDSDGNPTQPNGEVEICLTSTEATSDDLCLAFINDNNFWECQDVSLFPNENGEYCGYTSHFTVFSLMVVEDITPDPSTSPTTSPSRSSSISNSITPSISPSENINSYSVVSSIISSITYSRDTSVFYFVSTDIDDDDDVVVTIPDSFSFTQTIGDSTIFSSFNESSHSNILSFSFSVIILTFTFVFMLI